MSDKESYETLGLTTEVHGFKELTLLKYAFYPKQPTEFMRSVQNPMPFFVEIKTKS